MLNVLISGDYHVQYINSLAWYHNGTEIVSGNKYTISSNDTMLMISNMVGSDAGTYEVKVRSISYDSDLNSPLCDPIIPPLLELIPNLHPVTFTVQESHPPSYDPSSIISIAYVSDNANSIRLNGTVQYSSPLSITQAYHYWYRNGILLSDGDMYVYNSTGSLQEGLSLQIIYNNTTDVTGSYVGILLTDIYSISDHRSLCKGYYYYLDNYHSCYGYLFILTLWDIYGKYGNGHNKWQICCIFQAKNLGGCPPPGSRPGQRSHGSSMKFVELQNPPLCFESKIETWDAIECTVTFGKKR